MREPAEESLQILLDQKIVETVSAESRIPYDDPGCLWLC
ncbi:hypothetical protein AR1Y2_0432 [Anaerostipes rhamnosivorans]|uniref:Uncharacterized protein n=1 Tax=Anaerostipes rhamnosivorans TaxID=1229621 RepID=A0A4P8I921_9FIRM|nr:hypothetical protein AR1Y2_0432 [Anaerostipes rhamnosivorans]